MEQPNTPERLITDKEMVEELKKTGGLDNVEVWNRFNDWLNQLEAARTEDSFYDIQVSVRRAKVYYQAGFTEEAIADLEETLEGAIAEQGKDGALVIEISSLLETMEKSESI